MSLKKQRKNKEGLTPEELEALGKLLRAAYSFCAALDITLLLPKHRLPLPLDGDTPEERMQELLCKCSEIFEAVVASDNGTVPTINFSFIRWFSQVFSTEFLTDDVYEVLEKEVRKKYYSSKG